MALNGIHITAVLGAPLEVEDIPESIRDEWNDLVIAWYSLDAKTRDIDRMAVERVARLQQGKPDPYPELAEAMEK